MAIVNILGTDVMSTSPATLNANFAFLAAAVSAVTSGFVPVATAAGVLGNSIIAATATTVNIAASAGVGINSAVAPASALDVTSLVSTAAALSLYSAGNTAGTSLSGAVMALQNSTPARVNYGGMFTGITANTAGAHTGYLALYTATAGALTEKMRITAAGFVGIANTGPQCTLDAAGIIRATANSPLPTSGIGVEIGYAPGAVSGVILCYDRGASAYKPLALNASVFQFGTGNVGIGQVPIATFHTLGSTILGVPNTQAVADGNISNSQVEIWLDESATSKLTFRVRNSTGVLKTGTITVA